MKKTKSLKKIVQKITMSMTGANRDKLNHLTDLSSNNHMGRENNRMAAMRSHAQ